MSLKSSQYAQNSKKKIRFMLNFFLVPVADYGHQCSKFHLCLLMVQSSQERQVIPSVYKIIKDQGWIEYNAENQQMSIFISL